MRASWGEVKWLDVRPVIVPWLPDVGPVVTYLFRERVTDVASPVGDLVVVEQDDLSMMSDGRMARAVVAVLVLGAMQNRLPRESRRPGAS